MTPQTRGRVMSLDRAQTVFLVGRLVGLLERCDPAAGELTAVEAVEAAEVFVAPPSSGFGVSSRGW